MQKVSCRENHPNTETSFLVYSRDARLSLSQKHIYRDQAIFRANGRRFCHFQDLILGPPHLNDVIISAAHSNASFCDVKRRITLSSLLILIGPNDIMNKDASAIFYY